MPIHYQPLSPSPNRHPINIGQEGKENHNIPDLSASSSNTLNAVNFPGSTPCRLRIWILARENPHCGVSGVPFMNSTTGADPTASVMAVLVSADRKRRVMEPAAGRGKRVKAEEGEGRAAWRRAWGGG